MPQCRNVNWDGSPGSGATYGAQAYQMGRGNFASGGGSSGGGGSRWPFRIFASTVVLIFLIALAMNKDGEERQSASDPGVSNDGTNGVGEPGVQR